MEINFTISSPYALNGAGIQEYAVARAEFEKRKRGWLDYDLFYKCAYEKGSVFYYEIVLTGKLPEKPKELKQMQSVQLFKESSVYSLQLHINAYLAGLDPKVKKTISFYTEGNTYFAMVYVDAYLPKTNTGAALRRKSKLGRKA